MLVEGLAAHITGEWLRTLLTGAPVLLAAVWVVRHSSHRWRMWLWNHPELAMARSETGLEVRHRWGGWRFEVQGRYLEVRGGVTGVSWRSGELGRRATVTGVGFPTSEEWDTNLSADVAGPVQSSD